MKQSKYVVVQSGSNWLVQNIDTMHIAFIGSSEYAALKVAKNLNGL